jgi:hypothetical protein
MLTEKDYCDYDTCVALKELGFREKCPTYYDTEDNVGLLYNIQWALDNTPYQFTDCLESHNAYEGNSYVDAPTMWEVQKWLREEKKIDVMIQLDTKDIHLSSKYYSIYMSYMSRFRREFNYISKNFDSYEEALSEGIKESITLLKEEK